MAEVRHSRTIAAEPEAIWEVLADFGSLSAWAAGVEHSCLLYHGDDADPLGLTRRVQVGRDTFIETIMAFAPPRLLAYDISGRAPHDVGVEPVESAARQRRPYYRDGDQHRPDQSATTAPGHRTSRRAADGEALRGTAGLAGQAL